MGLSLMQRGCAATGRRAGGLLAAAALAAVSFSAADGQILTDPLPPLPQSVDQPTLLPPDQTIVSRPRPELDPTGFHSGPLFFFPRLDIGEAFNDNIYATEGDKRADFITYITPALDILSDYDIDRLRFRTSAEIAKYASNASEDYTDFFSNLELAHELSSNLEATGVLGFNHLHLTRDDPLNVSNAAQPPEYNEFLGRIGLKTVETRFSYGVDLSVTRDEYENSTSVTGLPIDISARTETAFTAQPELGWRFQADTYLFLRGVFELHDYDEGPPQGQAAAPVRGLQIYRSLVGLRRELDPVLYGEISVGVMHAEYDDARAPPLTAPDIEANLTWNPTQLTTVSLRFTRTLQDSVSFSAASAALSDLRSAASLSVDHELFRNLLLHAEVGVDHDEFQNIDRVDDRVAAAVGGRYFLNRQLYVGAQYQFERRASSGRDSINAFTRNTMLLRVGLQF